MRAIRACCVAASLLLLTGCGDLYEADPVLAARADSSAAGYDLAMRLDEPAPRPRPTRSPRTPPPAAPADTSAPAPAAPRTTTPAAAKPDSARPRAAEPIDTARRGTDVVTLPPELSVPADDSVIVNTFLSYNLGGRTVWVDVIAGFDGANGALNFNGGFEGAHTLAVPVGWRVEMRFLNRDRELSHSAIVVRAIDPIPMIAPPAAFPNAFTISLEEGIIEGRGDVVRFSADTEGRFLILCAVPGHGQSGMWVRLDVTRSATVPEYRR